ncbi:nucleotide-binding universal stress UspA family protein [Nocardia kruczakiae]|uniref:Nucleotide-binding universal stress UspA family protein n=1 Tax=Nocardia kruczakiae TaxID=261477 RepID=A0ABU1XD32_9NOCA|nr:hypothetical protein [Nocardia kruczakiae]MDR7167927.1 nucleotide-binding universal stress UspA family protein [Nocardia kruczakiae]
MSIDAIGFLRHDVSGARQPADENRIRALAQRLGYHLPAIVTFTSGADDLGVRLRDIAEAHRADAVVVPSVAHFDDAVVPRTLLRIAEVITVEPECTYARICWPWREHLR